MSREYANAKIKEALETAKGNTQVAQKLMIAKAMQDPKLLIELVRPHMTGIVAHAVNHVVKETSKPEIVQSNKTETDAQKDASSSKENFGLDLLKSIANGDSAQFGQESYARPVAKKSASQGHIDAIQEMIKRSQNKD